MPQQQSKLMRSSTRKGRANKPTKRQKNLQGYGQSQRGQVDNDYLTKDLVYQVTQKYLETGQNYVNFTKPQILRQIQLELSWLQRDKPQQQNASQIKQEKPQKLMDSDRVVNKLINQQAKKQTSTVYGKSQTSNKHQSTQHKDSQGNHHMHHNQDTDFCPDHQQQQNQSSGYYQQPYSRLLEAKGGLYGYHLSNKDQQFISSVNKINYNRSAYNNSSHQEFLAQLENIISSQVKSMELKQLKGNYVLQHITDDLQLQTASYQSQIDHQSLTPQELLKIRMHIQAISKLMVFVHGKSQFRLVISHYYIGKAYRINGCYEQAIDHFTIALKKNAKLSEIKQTKIYHSFILTSLSQCYFQLLMYEDALEILLRAYEIQQCYVNSEMKVNNIKTIRLISECYLKMKNYRQAIEYMEKICLIVEKLKGLNSSEYAQIKFEKAVIAGEEGNRLGAIEQVKAAIELVQSNTTIQSFQKNIIILQYSKKLADFLQRFGDSESQVQCLRQMLKIIDSQKTQGTALKNFFTKHIIAIKKKIIVIAVRHSDFPTTIKELQQVLELEQEKYGSQSLFVGKTLKMLGLVHLHMGNDRHAEEYFKRCFNLDRQNSEMRTEMKDLDRIFKSLGYQKRSASKKKAMRKSSKHSARLS